jgi:hypothetical protein
MCESSCRVDLYKYSISSKSHNCMLYHTMEEVPTTRHKSALSTMSPIIGRSGILSPNQTTPGLVNEPHLSHLGNSSIGMWTSFSFLPAATISACFRSASPKAGHRGLLKSKTLCWHSVHLTSNRRPCISINVDSSGISFSSTGGSFAFWAVWIC